MDAPLTDTAAVDADLATASSVLHLSRTIHALITEEAQLKRRVAGAKDECRQLLAEGRKTAALGVMRRAKAVKELLEKRHHQLANLNRMLAQVQMAGSNKQVSGWVVRSLRPTHSWVAIRSVLIQTAFLSYF